MGMSKTQSAGERSTKQSAAQPTILIEREDDDDLEDGSLTAAKLKLEKLIMAKRKEFNRMPVMKRLFSEQDQNLDKLILVRDLTSRLQCDQAVAQYALMMTNYQSLDDAVAFLFENDDKG